MAHKAIRLSGIFGRSWRTGVPAVMIALLAAPSLASAETPVPEVLSVYGNVQIERNGKRIDAISGRKLIAGDRFIFARGATVCIRTQIQRCLSETDQAYRVPTILPVEQPARPSLFAMFEREKRRKVRSEVKTRDHEQGRRDGGVLRLSDIAPFTQSPEQFMPSGFQEITVLLRGTLTGAVWTARTTDGRTLTPAFDPESQSLRFTDPVTEPVTLVLTDKGGKAHRLWNITLHSTPDCPAAEAPTSLTPDQQLERAVCLLASGPLSWRLFALSELNRLAALDVPNAQDAFDLARSEDCLYRRGDSCPLLTDQ